VEQGFQYSKIGIADLGPLQIDVKLTGYHAEQWGIDVEIGYGNDAT
jgi:hypothetical protein